MTTEVCTLFEGNYHYGLAGLSNSLYNNGFRGSIYAGYRGALPEWVLECTENDDIKWLGAKTFKIKDGMQIHFLPIKGNVHFTNYKADFMLQLWELLSKNSVGLIYFDPDIVVKCSWDFYTQWISHGVAVVHEISSNDMPASNPVRKQWEKIIYDMDMVLTNKLNSYLNAGFVGISRDNIEFLNVWSHLMDVAEKHYNFNKENFKFSTRIDPFYAGDQDAFNIAAMCCKSQLSEIGPEGMDFIHGGFTMSHAIGSPKPWNKNFLVSSLKGITPSMPDKEYWLNPNTPIKCFSNREVRYKKISINISGFIGRFYRKN